MKFKSAIYFVFLLIIFSCKPNVKQVKFDTGDKTVFGLASPLQLRHDTTILVLSDYFTDIKKIKKINYPAKLTPLNSGIGDSIKLYADEYISPLTTIGFETDSNTYYIPVLKSEKRKYVYSFADAEQKYKNVSLAGEFNAWNPANTKLEYKNGNWTTDLYLRPGDYAYQIVLDGKWQLDSLNTKKTSNGMGGWNSVLTLEKTGNSPKPQLHTIKHVADSIYIKISGQRLKYLVMFQNQRMSYALRGDTMRIIIPPEAKKAKRTYIRAWAFDNQNVSKKIFIPLDYGKVIDNASQLDRQDKERNILYYIMIDRYFDADKSNNHALNDPEVSPKADFHGGDIQGITSIVNSGYFDSLGITALWLSPIVKNPEGKYGFYNKNGIQSKFSAYHGYWPVSFTRIDSRFGNDKALNSLVKTAHKKDMNILLDFVANHIHEEHPFYKKYKDKNWFTDLYLPDGTLNTEKWDEHRLTTWFDVFLPTLNLEKNEVAEMLSDSAIFWIRKYDIDGFRHDATKHIPLSFWHKLTRKIKKESFKTGKKYYQVGETYGPPELINSYISPGLLDGQFDFNVYDALLTAIVDDNTGFDVVEKRLKQSIKYYGIPNLMGYMSGNQDKARFMALASGDIKLDEDSKYAGWSRNINKRTQKGFDRLAIMHAFIMTLPGVPVIYYGDEIGMTGGNDPDNRRDMRFKKLSTQEKELKNKLATLTHLRLNNPVFLYGELNFDTVTDNTMMYSRRYFDNTAVIIINNSGKKQQFFIPERYIKNAKSIKPQFGNNIDNNSIILKPYSFEVILIKTN